MTTPEIPPSPLPKLVDVEDALRTLARFRRRRDDATVMPERTDHEWTSDQVRTILKNRPEGGRPWLTNTSRRARWSARRR
jgi:hypothetical protein